MADSEQIQEIQWAYGQANTSGIVEGGIQIATELEIESTSEQLHRSANPAMLMTREGGDVLEGVSGMEKIGEGVGTMGEGEALAMWMGMGEKVGGEEGQGEKSGGGQGGLGEGDKTKARKAAGVGEKHERGEEGKEGEQSVGETGGNVPEEQREAEKEGGKEAKKQKMEAEGEGEEEGGQATATAPADTGKSHAKKAGKGRGRHPAKKAGAQAPRGPRSKKAAAAAEAAGDATMVDAATTVKKAARPIVTAIDPPAVHTRSRD